MPPFSNPVSRIISASDAPAYPWRLKSCAERASIRSRVSSPLPICCSLSHLKPRQRLRMEQPLVKLVHLFLSKPSAETSHQDIRRVHTNIWLGSQVFGKTMSREKAGDQLAIVEARHAQSLIIPVPRETQPYYQIFF